MTVSNDVPAKTVAEFIAYVKANPGKVNMASSGNGTSVHLSGEMFMVMSGAKMQHVPYRGAAPAITDLLGGQVQVIFDNMPSIIQHVRAGSLRALAVTTHGEGRRCCLTCRSVADTIPGYEASALFGMGVPKNTPKEIIAKLNKEINAVLAEPTIKARLIDLGGEPLIGTPDAFGAMIVAETDKWKKVIDGRQCREGAVIFVTEHCGRSRCFLNEATRLSRSRAEENHHAQCNVGDSWRCRRHGRHGGRPGLAGGGLRLSLLSPGPGCRHSRRLLIHHV